MNEPVPPLNVQPPSRLETSTDRPAKPRRAPIVFENLEQLIREAYRRKGTVIAISAVSRTALVKAAPVSPDVTLRLLEEVKGDVLLAVPARILRAGQAFSKQASVRRELVSFVGAALKSHPFFSASPGVASPLDALDVKQAFGILADRQTSVQSTPAVGKLQRRDLRRNAFHVLGVWFFETRETSVGDIAAVLHRRLWSASADAIKADWSRLDRLLAARDPAPLGIACEVFEASARNALASAADAQARERAALERLDSVAADLKEAQELATARGQKLSDLRVELADARRSHAEEITHLLDDRERIRAGALRAIRAEISLLEEALNAVRLTPPRTNVVVDHVERAIAGLRKEIKHLESES